MNFSWTVVGNLLFAACQWGMLVAMAKLTSPEDVGRFALGLAITAPVFMLANLQLRALQSTDARHVVPFRDYMLLRVLTSGAALLVCIGIVIAGRYSGASAAVIVGVAVAKAVEAISDVVYGLMQRNEKMDRVAKSMVARGLLAVAGLAAGVWATRQVWVGSIAMAVAWAAVLITYDLPGISAEDRRLAVARSSRHRAHDLVGLARTSLPLGVVMMLVSLNVNIPRYFIDHAQGERLLGIFAALYSVILVGNLVVTALGQSASARLAMFWADGRRSEFSALLWKLLGVGIAIGVGGVIASALVGQRVLAAVFTSEYGAYSTVLTLLAVAAAIGFAASFLGYALTAVRAFRIQVPLCVVVCGVTLVGSWFAVPRFGVIGAANALIVSALVQLAGCAIALRASTRAGVLC